MKKKNKYIAIYTHRYGADLLSFVSSLKLEELDEYKVAEALDLDWEPAREEYIDFFEYDELDFPDIDGD